MSDDEAALLRACQAAPGDALVRLVYADWLDERGDPRGAYLRREAEACEALIRGELDPRAVWADVDRTAVTPEWVDAAGVKCDVVLESYDPAHKIAAIVAWRDFTGDGLAVSKEAVESAPTLIESGAGLDRAVRVWDQLSNGIVPGEPHWPCTPGTAVVSVRRAGTEPAAASAILSASSPARPS